MIPSVLQYLIFQGPMAGAPARPALAAAVGDAGGLGFLAAGHRPAEATRSEIQDVRERTVAHDAAHRCRLTVTGPSPKFRGARDMLFVRRQAACTQTKRRIRCRGGVETERLIDRARGVAGDALSAARSSAPARRPRSEQQQIAQELFVSATTVKTHLAHIYRKLAVGDRTAAVTAVLERGILRLEES